MQKYKFTTQELKSEFTPETLINIIQDLHDNNIIDFYITETQDYLHEMHEEEYMDFETDLKDLLKNGQNADLNDNYLSFTKDGILTFNDIYHAYCWDELFDVYLNHVITYDQKHYSQRIKSFLNQHPARIDVKKLDIHHFNTINDYLKKNHQSFGEFINDKNLTDITIFDLGHGNIKGGIKDYDALLQDSFNNDYVNIQQTLAKYPIVEWNQHIFNIDDTIYLKK